MRILIKILISLVLFILVSGIFCFLGLRFFNSYILRNSKSEGLRVLVQMLMPPDDLYDYLMYEKIDVTKAGAVREFTFKNKYLGRHSFGIVLDNYSQDLYFNKSALKLKMQVSFYIENNLYISHTVESDYYSFTGRHKGGFGFDSYRCPDDLPKDKIITCRIAVITPDKEISDKYGPIMFYVKKMSDE
ncbi:MAG: hypothetical protein KKI13_05650 [Candidatus Omnitrophica bacterium]|nr:hypothetical protein [Candidatus Omnitrophota bacterium]MCG2704553.1 hypothetical protein [Candidatus Omnitrophota bacterium]